MRNMASSYQQYRKLNLKNLQKDKTRLNKQYQAFCNDLYSKFETIQKNIDYITENKSPILGKLKTLNDYLSHYEYCRSDKGHQLIAEEFYSRLRLERAGMPHFVSGRALSRSLKQFIDTRYKEHERDIEKLKSEITQSFAEIHNASTTLLDLNSDPELIHIIPIEIKESLDHLLEEIRTNSYVNYHNDIPNLISKFGVEIVKSFAQITGTYKSKLSTHKPKLSKEDLRRYAKNNIALLVKERRERILEISPVLDNTAGLIFAYAAYEIDSRRNDISNGKYSEFLNEQANKKLTEIKRLNLEDIIIELDKIHNNGDLPFNDYLFIKAKIEKAFAPIPTEDQSLAGTAELLFRTEVLSGLFGLSQDKSSQMAAIITEDQINNFEKSFISELGYEASRKLINENPNLLLLNHDQSNAFMNLFTELSTLSNAVGRPDYNPLLDPTRFSTFPDLRLARRDLYALMGTGGRPQIREIQPRITELDGIKIRLTRDGLDADMTMDILMKGFRYGKEIFEDDHRLSYDRLKENTARGNPDFDGRIFKQTMNKLEARKAILTTRGISRNSHINHIILDSIREAVIYARIHYPSKENTISNSQ